LKEDLAAAASSLVGVADHLGIRASVKRFKREMKVGE
jgi:hypothetical protein